VQDEGLVANGLHRPRQLGLICRGIDMRISVVFEYAEVPIEADINARRLHHVDGVRFQPDAASINLSLDVAVGEQHGGTISDEPLVAAGDL
jgi:hypothetical protein